MKKPSNIEFITFGVKQLKDALEFGFQKNVAVRGLNMILGTHWQAKEVGVHTTWHKEALQHSKAARKAKLKLGKEAKLIVEHVVPMSVIVDMLLKVEPLTEANVKKILKKYWHIIRITKEEDERLNKLGLNRKMPKNWDGKDPFARYKLAEIKY